LQQNNKEGGSDDTHVSSLSSQQNNEDGGSDNILAIAFFATKQQ
jgi:hypothetical protein